MLSRKVFVTLLILAIIAFAAGFIWRVVTHGP